ncbi:triose-phosphate transporter family-domain-containing protein [Rhexocercosporidium sp. MPI-PUGE-AT-0058]|nr:triose-phosphate transporter family-domain-containing protein [Rhexocercosporidium sp. MPI-PUGE-AT-0058]
MDPTTKRDSSYEHFVELKSLSPRLSESLDAKDINSKYTDDNARDDPKEALLSKSLDIEAQEGQVIEKPNTTVPLEYVVPLRTKVFYLGTYLFLTLALTIHSKILFAQFKFPLLLTAFHTGATSMGCYMLMLGGYIKPSKLSLRDNMSIVSFSMLCTINIAISNVSLALVSVAFHQIVRSIAPVFTVAVYKLCFGRSYSYAAWLACAPITIGVSMVAYGELDFTTIGFTLTLLGGAGFKKFVDDGQLTTGWVIALVTNGSIAFLLNFSSFQTNRATGALTMSVCGNLKQILTVLLGIIIFNVKIRAANGLGMAIAILGGAYYSKVELNNKQAKRASSPGS